MEKHSPLGAIIIGVALAVAIVIAGLSLSNSIYRFRGGDRFVSVKGLAEREVRADMAIWPISFRETSNDLAEMQNNIDRKRQIVRDFLVSEGFKAEDITFSSPKIMDTRAEAYNSQTPAAYRYNATTIVTLRSLNVDLVKKSMEKSGELVGKGVVMAENWENRTEFMFMALNDIKPDMIREATINARKAAEKFAEDSGSKVGKIRTASQGLFTITDRDQNSPDYKMVRVVTTVEYFLVDK